MVCPEFLILWKLDCLVRRKKPCFVPGIEYGHETLVLGLFSLTSFINVGTWNITVGIPVNHVAVGSTMGREERLTPCGFLARKEASNEPVGDWAWWHVFSNHLCHRHWQITASEDDRTAHLIIHKRLIVEIFLFPLQLKVGRGSGDLDTPVRHCWPHSSTSGPQARGVLTASMMPSQLEASTYRAPTSGPAGVGSKSAPASLLRSPAFDAAPLASSTPLWTSSCRSFWTMFSRYRRRSRGGMSAAMVPVPGRPDRGRAPRVGSRPCK
jgi:hypothetical protein